MNKFDKRPWALTFSYGRALQNTCIKTWKGDDANLTAAQNALIVRAKANSDAQLGKYVWNTEDQSANESLVIKNYIY